MKAHQWLAAVETWEGEVLAQIEALRRQKRGGDHAHDGAPSRTPSRRPARPIIPVWALGFGLSQLAPGSRRPKPPGGGG